jgi:16S rRNA (cytidine1402-2'-O)-methyltransferase
VVEGAPPGQAGVSIEDAVQEVGARVAGGTARRDAISAVAAETGVARRELYNAVVRGPAAD